MRNSIFFLFIVFVLSLTSCRKDFDFERSSGNLQFSKDTVYLDTVFTNIGSSTYTLKVYNRSNKDISIPTIQLGKGTNSKYRMMIDGMQGNVGAEGKIFSNVELLAKDSLYIFVETTIDYSEFANPEAEYLYTDQIQFDAGTHFQKVELVTLVKDAVFLFPNRDDEGNYETLPFEDGEGNTVPQRGFYLEGEELNMTKEKPYVIYGYAAVPPETTLNIAAGARLHFHAGSALLASNGSSIKVNGTRSETDKLENEVIFEGDRLEPNYAETPGQWMAIWLTQGSTGHEFTNLTIKNATVGIYVSGNSGSVTPDLKLKNVQIYNSGNAGILAQTGNIEGENVVINLAGSASLYCNYGGNYNFTQSTFNNNFSGTQKYAVRIDNFFEGATPPTLPLNATFTNSIIYGSNQNALLIAKKEDSASAFNTVFNNCLVKLSNSNTIVNNTLYAPVLSNPSNINKNPSFVDANKNNLRIKFGSEAAGKGTSIGGEDILGISRSNPSDLGAYKVSAE